MDALHPASKQRFGEYTWGSAPTPPLRCNTRCFLFLFWFQIGTEYPYGAQAKNRGKNRNPRPIFYAGGFVYPF